MFSRIREIGPSLGLRLGLWYLLLFVCSSMLLIVFTYLLLASSLRQRDQELIRSTLDRYAIEYQRGGLIGLNNALLADRDTGRQERLFVRVVSQNAELSFFRMPADWDEFDLSLLETPLANGQAWIEIQGRRSGVVLEVAATRLWDGSLLQVGKSSESRADVLERFRSLAALILLPMVVAGLMGGLLLTYSALQPVHRLIAAVRTIQQTGNMDARVPTRRSRDAINELSVLFNGMLDRIQALFEAMRNSLDNVAHDLKTPMARLRGIAEVALQSARTEGDYREALADCLEESERVVSQLDTLMDIAEAETGTMVLRPEPVAINGLLDEMAELYADLAEEKAVKLEVRRPDQPFTVWADRNRLRQAVANLVDNAVKYTPGGGQVELTGHLDNQRVAITVRDNGPGISPDDLPRIWDRLYRGDKSRSERGLGLGLSLVRAITEAHQGHIEAVSSPNQGSTFTLYFPADPAGRR